MKIFSTASLAALILGASAIMQSAPVSAEISGCPQLALECDQGNQEACHLYKIGCQGKASTGPTLVGTASLKNNHKPDTNVLNSKQNDLVSR